MDGSGKLNKYLVLGKMPAHANPDQYLAAGPWCFEGQEDRFPNWEQEFTFAPEPLANPDSLPPGAFAAQVLCMRAINSLPGQLAPKANLPDSYWQILLAPWAIAVSSQIVERALRCQAMIAKWGDEPLTVPIPPADTEFNFYDENDFNLNGALGLAFNHWLFSRLLKLHWPGKWQARITKPELPPAEKKSALNPRAWLRDLMLRLPFPKLKGMTLTQALQFSLALCHPCRQEDHSLDLASLYASSPLLTELFGDDPLLDVFMAAMPRTIRELAHPASLAKNASPPRLKIASIAAYENCAYRQRLAIWRALGNRLGWAQHGGNYGQILVACNSQIVEYSQDVFFTWGWTTHGSARGNFIPVPYPQLAAIKDSWRPGQSREIIFTGAEMALFGYRLESRPTPLQFIRYREAKKEFLDGIGQTMLQNVSYRPYFPIPGTLQDYAWLKKHFPALRLCQGPLLAQILRCNLLVLDNPGTVLLEAMAANIPVLLFWNPGYWPMTGEFDETLARLEKAGIWHRSPRTAAKKLIEIVDHTGEWWLNPAMQQIRQAFCDKYARLPDKDGDAQWMRILKQL